MVYLFLEIDNGLGPFGVKNPLGPFKALWAHGAHGPKCRLGPLGALWAHGTQVPFRALLRPYGPMGPSAFNGLLGPYGPMGHGPHGALYGAL